MKNALIILLITLSFPALAQNALFEKMTDEYSDIDGFSASLITSDMFDLYLRKKNIEEDSPVYEALNGLDNILVISQNNFIAPSGADGNDQNTEDYAEELHETLLEFYKKSNYTLFKTEKKMGEDLKVYLKKRQENIEALALLTNSSKSTSLIELQGEIDLATVSELSKAFNLRGLENLYRVNNSGHFVVPGGWVDATVYPHQRVEEMAERQREIAERQRMVSKEQREQMEKQAREMARRQEKMAEKYREMAEKYERQPIFLTDPGDTNAEFYIDGKKVERKEVTELDDDLIKSIEVNKSDNQNEKTVIRITTKKNNPEKK